MNVVEFLRLAAAGFIIGGCLAFLWPAPAHPAEPAGINICVDEKTADLVADSVMGGAENAYFIYNALERKGRCVYTDKVLEVDHIHRRVATINGTLEVYKMKPDESGRVYYKIGEFK